jgi:small-conductance mechanosensitive channel
VLKGVYMSFFSSNEPWVQWAISGGIFLIFLLLAFASKWILTTIVGMFTKRTKTILDDLIVNALTGPVFALLVAGGLWISITRLPETTDYEDIIHKLFIIVYIGIAAVAVVRVVHAILSWYAVEIAPKTKSNFDDRLIPILRRVADVIIYAMALMIILDQLHINISPILASLGIGGLAVALALQPTLSNFLSGTYVISDAIIRKGDYIQMDSGPEGTVEEIGWRTTKLRHWQGNLIVLPNSKLSDAIVTDYEKPDASMLFSVDCGVSYDSDLEKAEQIVKEVATDVMQKYPEGGKDFAPVMRFNKFDDSNINFTVVLKAENRAATFELKHQFIKALHRRFQKEGIVIEYPIRKLLLNSNAASEMTDRKKS